MMEMWPALGSAVWFGILTSISPCPLATNLAAVSFIAREAQHPWRTFAAGVLYALGRSLTYIALAALIVASLLEVPSLANFLQEWMGRITGPLLILVGLFLMGILRLPSFGGNLAARAGERVSRWGIAGSCLLGTVFALSFCPVSAALFFGSLLPIALEKQSSVLVPLAYGLGTGLPVLALAWTLMGGVQAASHFFKKLADWERPARIATAIVFILAGAYYSFNTFFLGPGLF
jgi:cytochrome c-type biogenesis protein